MNWLFHLHETQPVVCAAWVPDKAWDKAVANGWMVVSMKDSWLKNFTN